MPLKYSLVVKKSSQEISRTFPVPTNHNQPEIQNIKIYIVAKGLFQRFIHQFYMFFYNLFAKEKLYYINLDCTLISQNYPINIENHVLEKIKEILQKRFPKIKIDLIGNENFLILTHEILRKFYALNNEPITNKVIFYNKIEYLNYLSIRISKKTFDFIKDTIEENDEPNPIALYKLLESDKNNSNQKELKTIREFLYDIMKSETDKDQEKFVNEILRAIGYSDKEITQIRSNFIDIVALVWQKSQHISKGISKIDNILYI